MGNCSGLPSGQTQLDSDDPFSATPSNGLSVLPPNSKPSPPRPPLRRPRPRPSHGGRPFHTYIFGRELGRGQFGVTYLVTHKVTRQQFVCKSITTRRLINRHDIDDIPLEVQIMHHLTGHRNVVELQGAYEDYHSVNLIMELCAGGELFDRIIAKGHYSERAAANLCRQIVTVVHNCHSMGAFYRDLKPENFLSPDRDGRL